MLRLLPGWRIIVASLCLRATTSNILVFDVVDLKNMKTQQPFMVLSR